MSAISRCRLASPAALLPLVLLTACPTLVPVLVEPEPSDADTAIIAPDGAVAHKHGPFRTVLSYSNETDTYKLEFDKEGFDKATRMLDLEAAQGLPEKAPDLRHLRVELDESDYTDLTQIVVRWDPRHRSFVGVKRKVRSYRKTAEASERMCTRVQDLPEGRGIRGLAVSPSGDRIVYAEAVVRTRNASPIDASGTRGGPQQNNVVDLETCNLKAINPRIVDGGIAHITAESYKDIDPCYTPDGKHMLFASNRRRANRADILRILSVARGGGIQDIYLDPRDYTALTPSIGEDGTVAFALHPNRTGNAKTRIWTVGGPNEHPTQIVEGSMPHISPKGRRIAYIGSDGNLWVIHSDGTDPTQLTTKASRILERLARHVGREIEASELQRVFPYSYPSWSPDGKWILYSAMEGADSEGRPNEDLWIMPIEGGAPKQLTTNGSVDTLPVMSPDGKYVYFLSNRGGRWAIWRINAG